MIRREQAGWKAVVRDALDEEFPCDAGMRAFAEAGFSGIGGLLPGGKRAIRIRRSPCRGLGLSAGEE